MCMIFRTRYVDFVSHLTNDLTQRILPPTNVPPSPPGGSNSQSKDALRTLFVQLNQPATTPDASRHLDALEKVPVSEAALWRTMTKRLTLPLRLAKLGQTVVTTLRERNLPIHPSLFTPSSLRRLFPSHGVLRPNTLTVALFPHLRSQPYSIALSVGRFPPASAFVSSPGTSVRSACSAFISTSVGLGRSAAQIVNLPLDLTRGECRHKHQELKDLRDERADLLGTLVNMRDLIASSLEDESLQQMILGDTPTAADVSAGAVPALQNIAAALSDTTGGPSSSSTLRTSTLSARNLARPSRLTLLWPRLVFLPPLALYAAKTAYASRASLCGMGREAVETIRGFWEQWLLEPLRDVVKTVRAGGEDGVIVSRESVKADLDKLHYDAPQMEALSRQIQMGDLTPKPLKSAIAGTLLRTLFIQVQKAKVDIDQALAGIDKLLKSQELTFAFVGVAPALAIVGMWTGERGRGKYGGKKRCASIWLKMRRIERLLIAQPKSHLNPSRGAAPHPSSIPPLTSGLLLLSVSHLRAYAENYLPANSNLREGFLEDVVDLETRL
ncbi:ATP synthase regulation protein NCA2-domain-containing protein [Fomitopsis serialis]|uniref:ATP synthase regulation protein NCA2-domain-containing protein n=1 Tax=Fomitopsis serialis TaxID=139415 RepID=UPI002007C7E2|nr:ATP synthase regulation protein NCA2-domain-containing protein [Neoantrodia serialis]KAH9936205.1 ATP synthase regulation protein NCA2-domain-containing protein [Neoantrodia serialis]